MYDICFNRALEVIGTNQVPVPGCEPTSAMSSDTLARFNECGCAIVPLSAALEAIPGSTIRYGCNSGGGIRKKWFVFPEECSECPCETVEDYYAILRTLCREPETQTSLESCEVIWSANECLPDKIVLENEDLIPNSTYFDEKSHDEPGFSINASSPWFLQQINEANAAGEEPPAVVGINNLFTQNQEPVVDNIVHKNQVSDCDASFADLARALGNDS